MTDLHEPTPGRHAAGGEPPQATALVAESTITVPPRSSRQFVGLVGAGGATRIIALLSQIAIARLIGPAQVGSLAVALSLCLGVAVLSDAGLTALSVRRIVRDPQSRAEIVTATLTVQVVLTTGLGAVLVAVGLLLPWQGDIGTLLAISAPALTCVAFNTLYVFIAAERIAAIAVLRLVLAAAPAVASVAAAYAYRDAASVLIANIIGFVVYDVAVLGWGRRTLDLRFARRVARDVVLEMCRAGLPVMGSAVLLLVPTVAATVVAGAVLGPHSTGLFSAAWQFSFAAVGLWALVVDVFYPVLVRRFAASAADFRTTLHSLLVIGVRCALPVCVFVEFAARPLTHLVYGADFAAAVAVLRVLIWILPLALLWTLLSQALLAVEAERRLWRATAGTNVVLVGSCVAGADVAGLRGLAVGCLVGGAVQVVVYAYSPELRATGVLATLVRQAGYGVAPVIGCSVVSVATTVDAGPGLIAVGSLVGVAVAELLSRQKTLALLRSVTSS